MAVSVDVSIIAEVSGLGEDLNFCEKFAVTGTVIKAVSNRQIQAEAETAEALNLCGISTVELVIIKATTNTLYIDTDCADAESFTKDQSVAAGESRILKPDGTNDMFINGESAKPCTVDYLVVGSA